tara:strand:- start:656 stop:3469 length:2814 start_codon:yes stop_codon:yes gene_type:complete
MLNKKVAIEVEIKNIKRVSKLKKELQDLRAEMKATEKLTADGTHLGKKRAKQYSETATKVKHKSAEVRKLNKDLKNSNDVTKKVTKSNNSMAKQFVKGAAAIGIIVTAFRTVSRVISSVVSTFTEFEFVMAKVNAISGATASEFKQLSDSAQELGRTTFFTAEQVGNLQLNYSKLGFTTQEILDAQQATLDLATSTGTDLARAATVAGAAVRGFGLNANETERVVDVMAVSFASSAMSIEKWQTSMTKVAPIAKSAGFSIEDTAAIMSKLTDSGIEASIAGTSLRNILLKMQDPTSDLTKAFGKTIHGLDDLVPAMKAFVAQGGSMADVMEVVDLRQAAAFEQMITTADGTVELRNALLDAGGEGKRMADIVGDTLQGALLRLKSAMEGLSISVMENFASGLQSIVENLASFFNTLSKHGKTIAAFIKGIAALTKVIGIYKTVQFAANIATAAFAVTTIQATDATKLFITRIKALYTTMLANPYVAVGTLLLVLATDVLNLRMKVEETDKSWEKMNKTILGDAKLYQNRQEIIKALEGELASIQDVQRAKIAMKRIDEEVAAANESREAHRLQAQKNADAMFHVSQAGLKDAYVARTMNDFEEDIRLKKAQQQKINFAVQNVKLLDEQVKATIVLGEAEKEQFDTAMFKQIMWNDLVKDVIDGTLSIEQAQQQLRDFQIEMINNLLNDETLAYEERVRLETELTNLKVNNLKKVDNSRQAEIKAVSDLGKTLITIAGDEAKLQKVKELGIKITAAATLATNIDTIATNINTLSNAANAVAGQAKLIFPANLIAIGATIAAIASAFASIKTLTFGEGGIVNKYADGGMVHGKSHAQGGEKFAVGGRVAELEGGEAVINKKSTAMFKGQLSAMNAAGGGVKFADGGLMNMPSFASSQFDATGQQDMMGAMNQSSKVIVVEADITSSQNTVGVIEAEATF